MPLKGIKGGINSKSFGLNSAVEAGEETDAEFNNTALLLHGDGSEGAGDTAALGSPDYKAFKDNSTSAHAITVQGDAYGNDFSPYYYADGYWSNSFTADSLKVTTASDFDLSASQEFSIEFWLHPTAINASWGIFFYANPNDNNFQISHDSSGNVDLRFAGSQIGTPFALPLNTWSHLVITRDSSGYIRQFLDGVLKNYNQKTDAINRDFVTIGDRNGGNHFLGYISNVRWVKDSIPTSYQTSETSTGTTVFTSPTAPVTTSSQGATSADVKLLTCQSNRFKDTSDNQTFTFNGTPKVSTNTPFTVTKTANVGSGFFDGTGDYLTVNSDIGTLTGDFTIECFFYQNTTGFYRTIFSSTTTYTTSNQIRVSTGNNNNLLQVASGGSDLFNDSSAFINNQWNHVALVRSGTTLTLYLNGTSVGSATNSTSFVASSFQIGDTQLSSTHYYFDGYIADTRVVNGTAVYTSNFTPPTTTLTSTGSETKLLTCQYSGAVRNVGFLDDSKYNHVITRNGDVSMGTFSPFSAEDGYWSVYFDHNNDDKVVVGDTQTACGFGSSADFQIDCMIYSTRPSSDSQGFFGTQGTNTDSTGWRLQYDGSNIDWNHGTSNIHTFAFTFTPNTWFHFVIQRVSGTFKIFVDGVEKISAADTTNYGATTNLTLGNGGNTGAGEMSGYLSNLRVITAASSTTSQITSPLSSNSDTLCLVAQSNRFVDNSSNNKTLTATNTPKVQPFSPFAPSRSYSKDAVGGSAYYDGTGDYLTITSGVTNQFEPGSAFTFECWVYNNGGTNNQCFEVRGSTNNWSASTGILFQMYVNFSGSSYWQWNNGGGSPVSISGTAPPSYSWAHLCIGYNGTTTRFWVNGQSIASSTTGYTPPTYSNVGIGSNVSGTLPITGYLSNARFVKGTDIYGANNTTITVPTAPFLDSNSNYDDTVLLTRFDNAGIIDHTMKNNLETEGNTRISGQQTKFGTGSIYFDGTGDYIQLPFNENLNFGTGSFTWEAWVHPTDISGIDGIYATSGGSGGNPKFVVHLNAGTPSVHYSGVLSSNSYTTATSAISADTWTYLAYVRNGTTWTWYINGVASGTGSETGADLSFTTQPTFVGYGGETYFTPFNGYIDEMRVTKGVARYTSNFTAPTKAFANK